MNRFLTRLLLLLVRAYQLFVSPLLGAHCRFHPSCSHYAREALTHYGAFRGSMLAAGRLLRCRPFAKAGFDPLPPRKNEP